MRTVSFSNEDVRTTIKENFVCHAFNTDGDPTAGGSQAHAPDDPTGWCTNGIGHQNVQVLFMTPEAEIFHTATGYRDAEALKAELEFAQTLFDEILNKPESARELVVQSHKRQAAKDGFPAQTLSTNSEKGHSGSPWAELRHFMPTQQLINMKSMDVNEKRKQLSRPLAMMTKLRDYRFICQHPMLSFTDFSADPSLLVGNGSSYFSSGSGSGRPIGTTRGGRSVQVRSTQTVNQHD